MGYISQKVGLWTLFGYQIKAESVLLTMIPKTHFTQNVTCSLFCGSASHDAAHHKDTGSGDFAAGLS